MENGKIDNQLNLALSMDRADREETLDLDVGFDSTEDRWEVIVRYNGDIEQIANDIGAASTVLLSGFAILQVPEDRIEQLAEYEEIEYIEKPKRIFFETNDAKQASCINTVRTEQYGLTGRGVLVALIDSGIDYSHPDFRNSDGTTRIRYLWDQTVVGTGNALYGTVYDSDDINRALAAPNLQERYEIVPSYDSSGHGTAVAGILCGNGSASQGAYRGVAYESDIIAVKLGTSINNSFPRTTQLMEGVDFCAREALRNNTPIAVNISFGNNYGGHDGNSLLENYLNEVANTGRICITAATGNEGAAGHHAKAVLTQNGGNVSVEFAVAEGEAGLNLQIWKEYQDEIDFILHAPSGWNTGIIPNTGGAVNYSSDSTKLYILYGEPQPYNISQEIYFEFIPDTGNYIQSGIWRIELIPRKISDGICSFWLPTGEVIGDRTRFLTPSDTTTLTIPSTAERVISVGAYNSDTDAAAFFSGNGFTRNNRDIKPDIVAPGVGILTVSGGGYSLRTGTSFAAPFVTGSAALLMQWGIIDGNDRYLYGEKVKAYLIRGARRLPGFANWPNPQAGWGALCLSDSIPV